MNQHDAKILLGDETALLKLSDGKTPLEAVQAVLAAVQSTPAVASKLTLGLAEIVADDSLEFKDGVFSLRGRVTDKDLGRIFTKAIAFFSSSDSAGNMGRWILGNIAWLVKQSADRGDWENFIDGTELAYNTIITSLTTFEFFQTQRYKMPFSHHKEIAYAADLSPEQKHSIAAYVADQGLALTTSRALIRLMQSQVRDKTTVEEPETLHGKIDTPIKAGKRFLVIGTGGNRKIVDRAPAGAEVEEAEEIYEIRSILKSRVVGGGAADAPGPVRTPVPTDEPGVTGEG